jgi:hypothetical protein
MLPPFAFVTVSVVFNRVRLIKRAKIGDEDSSGIVYIRKNEAMPGYVKVGRAANLKERMSTLDTSGYRCLSSAITRVA